MGAREDKVLHGKVVKCIFALRNCVKMPTLGWETKQCNALALLLGRKDIKSWNNYQSQVIIGIVMDKSYL